MSEAEHTLDEDKSPSLLKRLAHLLRGDNAATAIRESWKR